MEATANVHTVRMNMNVFALLENMKRNVLASRALVLDATQHFHFGITKGIANFAIHLPSTTEKANGL